MQRVATWRWQEARAARHNDGGHRLAKFRKRREAPGFACIPRDERSVLITLFMKDKTRARYHRTRPPNAPLHFRNQQHAPPATLPHDTIELFVAGDADARKKDAPPPPAGCGVVAVESGSDERIFTICGQITTATPGVKTVTGNLAALVAFTRALLWAAQDPLANPILARGQADRPICIRYANEYAAMIATGVWQPKKHKAMAEKARQAWKRLKRQKGERLWIQHAHQHSVRDGGWLREASHRAAEGKHGASMYAADVSP